MGLKWYLSMLLICISLMASNIGYFCIFGEMSFHIIYLYFSWVVVFKILPEVHKLIREREKIPLYGVWLCHSQVIAIYFLL